MAAPNVEPLYSRQGDIQFGGAGVIGPTANTAQDGTGSAISSVYQADTTNGNFLSKLVFESAGSPAATVARVFICSVTGAFTAGTSNTAANTAKYAEVTLPSVTLSQTAAAPHFEVPMNIQLPPGYRVLVSFGTSTGAAGTGWVVSGVGGKY